MAKGFPCPIRICLFMLINETAPLFSATQHRSNHVSLFIIIHYLILPKEERVVPKG